MQTECELVFEPTLRRTSLKYRKEGKALVFSPFSFHHLYLLLLYYFENKKVLKFTRILIYTLMALVGLVAMYTLLNAGNPEGLLRPIFPDPMDDVYIAVFSSLGVFILGFFVFFFRDQEGFQQLVEINGERIRKLRKKKKSDEEIADSILQAMAIRGGFRYNLAKKKLIIYLSKYH